MPRHWRSGNGQIRCDSPQGPDVVLLSAERPFTRAPPPPFTPTTAIISPAAMHLANSRRRLLLQHKQQQLIPSLRMAMPTTHRSLSNTLVHYHFVYNLPLYCGLMNCGSRSGNTRGGHDEDELTRLARQLGFTYDIHPVNVRPLYTFSHSSIGSSNKRRSDRDRPGAIVRRKQRIAAYADCLEQAAYFAGLEQRVVGASRAGAACDSVDSDGSDCESDEEGLSRGGGLRNRFKSGLDKIRQKTGQAKVRGSEMTGRWADKIKMKQWKRKAAERRESEAGSVC